MRRVLTSLSVLLASTAVAAPVVFKAPDVTYTLQGCSHTDASTVRCDFTVISAQHDTSVNFDAHDYRLISPTGVEAVAATGQFNGTPADFFTLRQGITYPLNLTFKAFPGSSIKYFDIYNTDRQQDIPIASGAALPTTTALPGRPQQRLRVKIGTANMIAVMHGCAATSSGASCLVTLLDDGATGTVGKDRTVYSGFLMQVDGQTVKTDGTVDVMVGDGLFQSVPVSK